MTMQNPLGLGLNTYRDLFQNVQTQQNIANQRQNQQIAQDEEARRAQKYQAGIDQGQAESEEAERRQLFDLLKNIRQLPADQRMAAMQSSPFVQSEDFAQYITPEFLSDQGLDQVLAANPYKSQEPELGVGEQAFNNLIAGMSPEDQEMAKRIRAGLEARAVGRAPKVVTYGGKQYMQQGETLMPIQVGASGQVVMGEPTTLDQISAQPVVAPQMTPEQAAQEKIDLEAQAAAEKTKAVELAKQEVKSLNPEEIQRLEKKERFRQDTVSVLDGLMSGDLDRITGMAGRLPTFLPESEDLLVMADRLESLLTADNLDLMTGVLSETDIKILGNLAGGFGLERDSKGRPERIKGSEEALRDRLDLLKKGLVAMEVVPMIEQSVIDGEIPQDATVITDPETGIVFEKKGNKWVAR